MADTADDTTALRRLQEEIYRDKVRRARTLSMEQRLAEALEMTNVVYARMHEGAMWQLGTNEPEAGWREVRRRLDKLARVHDEGRFESARPVSD